MNYKKLLGWGIGIYAMIFLVISCFIAYGIDTSSLSVRIISIVVVAVMAFFAGKNLKAGAAKEIMKYSVGWMIIVAILDVVLTVPFTGWAIYSSLDLWFGYALIIFVPLLALCKCPVCKCSPCNCFASKKQEQQQPPQQ